MGMFFAYILQVSFVMALLYVCYRVLLSTATFHSFKRWILLSALLLSWLVPVPYLLGQAYGVSEVSEFLHGGAYGAGVVEIGNLIPVIEEDMSADTGFMNWCLTLVRVYTCGVAIAFAMTLFGAVQMWLIIHQGRKIDKGTYVLVVSKRAGGPFSWGKYIVLRPEDCDADMELILLHEMRHLRRRHWIDLLLSQITTIFVWFSPFTYLTMREFKKLHEFEADEAVASADARRYQLVLIKKTVGPSFQTFANSLTHSQIKLRITMMMKKKSSSVRRLAALAVPAAAAFAVLVISQPSVARVLNDMAMSSKTDVLQDKVSKTLSIGQDSEAFGVETLKDSDATKVVAVSDDAQKAQELEQQAKAPDEAVSVSIVIDEPESATASPAYFVDGKLFTSSVNDIDTESIKSVTIVKNDPAYPNGKIMIELKKDGEDEPCLATEQTAEFKGGSQALFDFLASNTKYPEDLDKKTRVIVQFTIDVNGNVSDCKVLRGGSDAANAEACRVVNATTGMWIPAKSGGKAVSSRYAIPISFSPKK